MEYTPPHKIAIKPSIKGGFGVFAKDYIKEGEIIEICPLYDLKIPKGSPDTTLYDYRFIYPNTNKFQTHVIPWGYGCLYNHNDTPNAKWRDHATEFAFEFFALRNIQKDEEIYTYYGNNQYWANRKEKK